MPPLEQSSAQARAAREWGELRARLQTVTPRALARAGLFTAVVGGLGWLAAFFALPGMRPLARRVYGWIARNRMRISCALSSSR